MKTAIRRTLLVSLLAASFCGATAAEDLAKAQALQREAAAAYQAGDIETFTELSRQALAANPASQAMRYNFACGLARTGHADEALELLAQLARARIDFGMEQDPDLESLRETPRFKKLLAGLKAAVVPVSSSTRPHAVEQFGLLPEGTAIDPASGRQFFGSMRSGQIFVLTANGQLSEFARIVHGGKRLSALGMIVDPARKLLWVVGSRISLGADFDPGDPPLSGAFAFDLAKGDLRRASVTANGGAGFNDLAIGPDGDVYLTGARFFRVPPGSGPPQPVELRRPLVATNGITFSGDGKRLYVSVYPVGLARIDLAAGTWRYVAEPDGQPLIGIDGLYWYEGDLIAIQNGLRPWRLLRLALDETGDAVTAARTIEFANASMTAMTGAIRGDEIIYVGRAPAPDEPPAHLPGNIAPLSGKTIFLRAPLE